MFVGSLNCNIHIDRVRDFEGAAELVIFQTIYHMWRFTCVYTHVYIVDIHMCILSHVYIHMWQFTCVYTHVYIVDIPMWLSYYTTPHSVHIYTHVTDRFALHHILYKYIKYKCQTTLHHKLHTYIPIWLSYYTTPCTLQVYRYVTVILHYTTQSTCVYICCLCGVVYFDSWSFIHL